jgi:hypothetical protein
VSAERPPNDQRCPTCGVGVVADITWDDARGDDVIEQRGDSRQIVRYSCGHESVGPAMDTSDAEQLDVERRRSEDTA